MKTKVSSLLAVLSVVLVPALGLQCLNTTMDNEDCTGPDNPLCFVRYNGDTITRGCLKESDDCNPANCKTCTGDNCNKHLVCRSCNGSVSCAQEQTRSNNKICDDNVQHCHVLINNDSLTERGCATAEISNNCPEEKCNKCDKDLCNTEVFPTTRLSCYQCSGESCSTIDNDKKAYCNRYDKDDQCYTYGNDEKEMVRGCVSDDDFKCKKDQKDESCLVCSSRDCNNLAFMRPPKMKCYKCENCTNPPDTAEPCKNDLSFAKEEEYCFTNTSKGATDRGCLYDTFKSLSDCKAEEGCVTCKTDSCNKDTPAFECITCRSDNYPNCWGEIKDSSMTCKNQTDPQKCFHGTWNGVVVRGCLNDASEQTQATCNKGVSCTTCDTTKCNWKSSGAASWMSFSLSICLALVATRLYIN